GVTNAFNSLASIMTAMAKAEAAAFPNGLPAVKGSPVAINGWWVAPSGGRFSSPYERDYEQASAAASERVLEEYERSGVFDACRKMLDDDVAIAVLPAFIGPVLIWAYPSGDAQFRQLTGWEAARMRQAVRSDDPARFAAALNNALGYASLLERQPSATSWVTAAEIEAQAYGAVTRALRDRATAPWLDAVAGVLGAHEAHGAVSVALDGEKIVMRDAVCWVFADPDRARLGTFSPGLRTALASWSGTPLRGRLGSLEENLTAVDAFCDGVAAAAASARANRRGAETYTGDLAVVRQVVACRPRLLEAIDRVRIDREGVRLLVALERHRLEHGAYPASLTGLIPAYIAREPVDPWTGKGFGYRRIDPQMDAARRGYLLYSFGSDGVDNGGVNAGAPLDALLDSTVTGSDYIINDPRR
ncbi:MAG: hypothetical protein K2Q09_03650, partial [Phycisphaerales bacterium]|nr:hypothetical protein [Phycisphaerales bacterium]